MSDLVAFLRARLAEDEEFSRDAYPGIWRVERNDPDCVRADVESKRRIIAECQGVTRSLDIMLGDCVLALLALPYAGHPDYRQEWKP